MFSNCCYLGQFINKNVIRDDMKSNQFDVDCQKHWLDINVVSRQNIRHLNSFPGHGGKRDMSSPPTAPDMNHGRSDYRGSSTQLKLIRPFLKSKI